MAKVVCRFFLQILLCCLLSAQAADAQDKSPIRIGAILPFSGGVEVYGKQAEIGLDLAAKEINAGGGILGRPVEIIYEDSMTNPDVAAAAARKLTAQPAVLALIGPITSRDLNAISPIAEAQKTPLLYATNYEGGTCGRYFFSLNTVPNQELATLLPYMKENFGNTFYMLGADRVWPHKMFDAAEPMIEKLGGKLVGKAYATGQEKDFAPLVAQVQAAKPKVLLFALKGDGMNFIAQADNLGLLKQTTVAYLGMSEADLKFFGGKGQNMFVVVPFVATSEEPAVKDFVFRVRKDVGADAVVSHYVVAHYNALMALKSAVEKAGRVDREALADALVGLSIKTPTGPLTIGANHHASMKLFLAKTKGTELVLVKDLGECAPEPGCP